MDRTLHKFLIGALAWAVALTVFFPIFWMLLTGFKTEVEAFSTTPALFFSPTLENYDAVQQRSDYLKFASNSVMVSFGATLLALALAIPAAYSMAFFPTRRTNFTLLWMLSTKMLPSVGVLMPVYLMFRWAGLLDRMSASPAAFANAPVPVL